MADEPNTQKPEPIIAPQPNSISGAQPSAPKKSYTGIKIAVIVIIAVVGLTAYGIFSIFSVAKGASDAASGIVADIQAGRCQVVYAEKTALGFREVTTAEQWVAGCETISPILQGEPSQEGINVQGETGSPSTALLTYEIVGTDTVTYDVIIDLVKQDGEWKMLSFDSVAQN